MKFICALFLLGCLCHQISAGIDRSHQSTSLVAQIQKNYLVSEDKANWYGALKGCRLRGMNLVSIDSEEENDNIKEEVGVDESGYWTSGADLHRLYYNYEWMGSGEAITTNSYTNWKEAPRGDLRHCIAFLDDGRWTNTDCYVLKKYICEYIDPFCVKNAKIE